MRVSVEPVEAELGDVAVVVVGLDWLAADDDCGPGVAVVW